LRIKASAPTYFENFVRIGMIPARPATLNKMNASLKTFLLKIPVLPAAISLLFFIPAVRFFCLQVVCQQPRRKIAVLRAFAAPC